jgi:2-methylisocitrate lyase-like PEP mutase family enzyme
MEIQADYIAGIRAASEAVGVPIVVNARMDVFICEVGDPAERVAETLRRATAYREAGADCRFPIEISDEEEIRAVVKGADIPVYIWMPPGMSLRRLEQLGVARISFGGALHNGSMDDLSRRLTAIRAGEWSLG